MRPTYRGRSPPFLADAACDARPKATAARLGVHPDTVSYRLNQLRAILRPVVEDPHRRAELHLATYIAQAQSRRDAAPTTSDGAR